MKVIMHNSVSLDGCYTDIEVDMGLHYQIAGWFSPDIHLIGSATARTGAMMGGSVPDEDPGDFIRPSRQGPLWVVVDSKGATMGILHALRRSPRCSDVAVVTTRQTRKAFLEYLKKRDYRVIMAGDKRLDLKKALGELRRQGISTVLVDSGAGLNNALLAAGLVDEISLIVCPEAVGADRLLDNLPPLELVKAKKFGSFAWLLYRIIK